MHCKSKAHPLKRTSPNRQRVLAGAVSKGSSKKTSRGCNSKTDSISNTVRLPSSKVNVNTNANANANAIIKAQSQRPEHRPLVCWSEEVEELQDYSLPESDPITTTHLWEAVALCTMQRGKKIKQSSLPLRTGSTTTDVDTLYASNTSTRSRALRPQQYLAFQKHILTPRHITIDATLRSASGPFAHFGTQKPASYKVLNQLGAARVLLEMQRDEEKEIAAQYTFMDQKRLCEAEFSTYAIEKFFHGEPRGTPPAEDRLWRAERMLQLVCPPIPEQHWVEPPLIETDVIRSDDYSWDIRPDCTYWISSRGFNEEYVHMVDRKCFVYQDWVLCPYLTIEFKRDSEDISAAQTQAVTAGAIALYNRHALRVRARQEAGLDGTFNNITHYAITFTGPRYTIWEIRPNDTEELAVWNGCCMRFLDRGNCTHTFGVNRLVEWINEIHRWGMSVHAPACEIDVKQRLNDEGIDTSTIAAEE